MSTSGVAFFNAARAEIIERIKIRDQIILSFIVASGAVVGLAIGDVGGEGNTIALIIPYLGLGTTILVATHNMAITNLGRYFQELEPAINECRMANAINEEHEFIEIRPWDVSEAYKESGERSSKYRMIGQLIIIFMPSAAALFAGWEKFNYPFTFPNDLHSLVWVWGTIATLASMFALIYIHINRGEIVRSIKTNK